MKLGILISGRGSNMLAIAEAIENGTIRSAEIAVFISDKEFLLENLEGCVEIGKIIIGNKEVELI